MPAGLPRQALVGGGVAASWNGAGHGLGADDVAGHGHRAAGAGGHEGGPTPTKWHPG